MTTALSYCDRSVAPAKPPAARAKPAHPRLILATTVLASSLAFIDSSVVNVGLPAIARSFPDHGASVSWLVSGYLLPLSALLLLGGAAGDRFGHRRLLLGGIGLFITASLLCAMAPTLESLLFGRMLQGVGAAMLMPTSLAILGGSFSGKARGEAIGIWAAAGAATVIGALLMASFIVMERARGAAAMIPLALFASREFTGLSLVTVLLYGAHGVILVLLPYVLIDLKNYSATEAGAALLPMPIVIALTAPSMGRLAARIGARLPLSIGPAVVAAGFLLALRIPSGTSYWTSIFPAMLVLSLGMASAVAPLTTAVLASVEPSHSGIASGLNSALARTGGLVANALASAVLVSHGEMLASTFRWAMALAAVTAAVAGACAFVWLARKAPA
jgi:MFS family permease